MGYRINYSKVISQADSIAGCANELSKQVNQLSDMEQSIRSTWKGQAADAFISRVSTLRGEISRTKDQIASLAKTIKDCADRIKREDEEEQRRAAALKSGGGSW